MDPGIYLYRGKLFQLEDTREGAHFKSSGGDYFFSKVAVPYTFQGKKCLDIKIEDFLQNQKKLKKLKL